MELTDEAIRSFFFRVKNELDNGDEVDEIERMALAHNAARKAEPVAWRWKPKDATKWIYNPETDWLRQQTDHIDSEPLYAAPPDLEAKLKEARELLERWISDTVFRSHLKAETELFLARTK